jgi:hypothetical protein
MLPMCALSALASTNVTSTNVVRKEKNMVHVSICGGFTPWAQEEDKPGDVCNTGTQRQGLQ